MLEIEIVSRKLDAGFSNNLPILLTLLEAEALQSKYVGFKIRILQKIHVEP
jgi:hypothetical protein